MGLGRLFTRNAAVASEPDHPTASAPNGACDGDGHRDEAYHGHHDGIHDGHHHGHHSGAQPGHHDGAHDGHRRGKADGEADGNSDGSLDRQPSASVEYYVVGDRILAQLPGLPRPQLTALGHAVAFLTYLQDTNEFCGRWIAAAILEKHLYPEFIEDAGWQSHAWKTVAREFGKLTKKRQKDCRSGADRRGPSPREYLVPKPRSRALSGPALEQDQGVAKVA